MALYRVSPKCLGGDIRRAWLVLCRGVCPCGHETRPYWSLDSAASALIMHQMQTGTRIDAPGDLNGQS